MALVVTGLALLGWVAWQMFGTTWIAKREQADSVTEIQRQWREGGESALMVDGERVDAVVRIPSFGDDYAVPLVEGTDDSALTQGFGHFEESAEPGARGNFSVAGHRITHGEPLRDMPSLQVDDEVDIITKQWTYTYRLVTGGDDLRVTFEDTWVVDRLPTNPDAGGVQPPQRPGQRLLTLTTCAELFHTDDRLIAFGVLEERTRTT